MQWSILVSVGAPRPWAVGRGLWGLWGFHTHPGRGAGGSAVPLSCALSHITDSLRAPGLLPGLCGGQEGAGSPQHPKAPFQAQLQGLIEAGGAVGNSAPSPAQSRNSQLELGCTSLVQWYLSLLALSDLITRKKLNLTSCRCPEGTLQNSCFSQRLLILHVRASIPVWPLIRRLLGAGCGALTAPCSCCLLSSGDFCPSVPSAARWVTPSEALGSYWCESAFNSRHFAGAVMILTLTGGIKAGFDLLPFLGDFAL